jgi:hypothetical protein
MYKANNELFEAGIFLVDVFPPARYLPSTPSYKKLLANWDVLNTYILEQVRHHKENVDPG